MRSRSGVSVRVFMVIDVRVGRPRVFDAAGNCECVDVARSFACYAPGLRYIRDRHCPSQAYRYSRHRHDTHADTDGRVVGAGILWKKWWPAFLRRPFRRLTLHVSRAPEMKPTATESSVRDFRWERCLGREHRGRALRCSFSNQPPHADRRVPTRKMQGRKPRRGNVLVRRFMSGTVRRTAI